MVHEREVIVDEPFTREDVQVERVPVNRFVAEPVSVRYEGDTMIIPVMEELTVVEKRLHVKEELRVTKRQITTPQSRPVRLRTEEVHMERVPTQERLRSDE
jgi:stress response protein YsnF